MKEAFREIRKVSTPWVSVITSDYRAAVKTLLDVRRNGEDEPPAVMWDYCRGHRPITNQRDGNEDSIKAAGAMGDADTTANSPVMLLLKALDLPEDTILFFVVPKADVLDSPDLAQALANLRDEFKSNGRTLVLLGPAIELPSLIKADVPVIEDPLPTRDEIREIAKTVYKAAGSTPPEADTDSAVEVLSGLTRFACEEGLARKLRKKGIDLKGLGELQKSVIEESTNRALTFEKETWTFDDVGGLTAFKGFMGDLFKGPKPPSLIVRIDEIDKSISAAATGSVGDNSGTTQDQLKVLLESMENNKWAGILCAGGPGCSKTLASIATGNTFGVRTLAFDLGATKNSLVGASERAIRQVMATLKSIGGDRVMLFATANRLDTLPPELQRRFWLGTWMFPVASPQDRKQIWAIQRKRFNINDSDKTPDDTDWTGSDVRNCCQMAYYTSTTLAVAASRITIAGKASKDMIERLSDLAERSGFLSASEPGPYRRSQAKKEGRKLQAI